jgi:acyl carrier protein
MSNQEKFKQIIAECLRIDPEQVKPSLSQDHVDDWDSVTMVTLISEIETAFNVTFDVHEMLNFKTIGLITELLKEKGVDL